MNMVENVNGQCELTEDDLTIEQKFFTLVAYDSDDSDSEWHGMNADGSSKVYSYENTPKLKFKGKSCLDAESKTSACSEYTDDFPKNTEYQSSDADAIDIVRNHRKLVVTGSSRFSKALPEVSKEKESSDSFNCSYPQYRWSSTNSTEVVRKSLPSYTASNRTPHGSPKFSYNIYNYISNSESAPIYNGYQLLGDSQLLRFSEQILSLKSKMIYAEDSKIRHLGYCVSGQRIKDLEDRLLKKEHKLLDKVIMLIGTNDFLQNSDYEHMLTSYMSIIEFLEQHAETIVLLTVPPIPKFNRGPYWYKFKKFNDHIMNLSERSKITVVDLAVAFIGYDNRPLEEYFEHFYENSGNRIDKIHLNTKGFKLLKCLLDIHVFNS